MNELILARRYAQAFVRTVNKERADDFYEKLENILLFLKNNKEFVTYLNLPYVAPHLKKDFLEQLCSKYNIHNFFHSLIALLVEHKRSFLFGFTLQYIKELYKEQTNVIDWTISSYPRLNDKQLQQVIHFLENQSNKKAHITYKVDETLIAGIRIQSAFYIWENSVNKIVKSLKNNFDNGVYNGN